MNETWQDYCDSYAFLAGKAFGNAPEKIMVRVFTTDGEASTRVKKLSEAEFDRLNAEASRLRSDMRGLDSPDQWAEFESLYAQVAPLNIVLLNNARPIKG